MSYKARSLYLVAVQKIVAPIVPLPENRVQQHHCMSCRDLLCLLFELHLWCCMCNLSFSSAFARGGATCPDFRQVCAPAEPKSRPTTRAKFFIQKPPKTYKNDMNLLIFLDLTYNPGKNFKFYSLQGQNVKIFLIFTYNQGKVFLILPITRGAHVYDYTWSPLGVAPAFADHSCSSKNIRNDLTCAILFL